FPLLTFAQNILKGKITDETTNEPIQFATVQIDTKYKTISNESGEFELNVATLPTTLFISHVSYQALKIQKNNNELVNIKLKPLTLTLKEVVIGDYAVSLMKNAFEKGKETTENAHYGKGFLRQIAYEADRPTYLNEMYFNTDWRNFGMVKWHPLEARYLRDKATISYTNLSFFTLAFSGFLANNVHHKGLIAKLDSIYTFKLKGTYQLGDEEIAIVSCKPKVKLSKMYFEGDYFINTNTYDVLKLDGTVHNFNMNSSGILGIKNEGLKLMAQYKLDKNGINVLDFSTFNVTSRLKVLGIGAKTTTFASTLFMVDYGDIYNKDLEELSVKTNDISTSKGINFNPSFWNENQTIKRT
ncbi:MAG: carboxypeptidase-like regulatory domain-containing protein, partial [Pedobacter sp.]